MLAAAPAVELELGLVAEVGEGLGAHLADAGVGRCVAERLERRDLRGGEPLDLRAADPSDERQVVVVLPALLAARGSRRDRSARPGTGRRRRRFATRRGSAAQPAVVREVVVGPEGLALAEPVDHVHLPRACAPWMRAICSV